MAKSKKSLTGELFIIKGARLSFPNLYRKGTYNGTENRKFDCTLILDGEHESHEETIKKLMAEVDRLIKEGPTDGEVPDAKYMAVKNDKIRKAQGRKANRPEYEGHITVKAGNEKRPHLLDKSGHPSPEEDGLFESGYRVNAQVTLFSYASPDWGPMIGANLIALQFEAEDEPFGEGSVSFDEAAAGFGIDLSGGSDEGKDVFG